MFVSQKNTSEPPSFPYLLSAFSWRPTHPSTVLDHIHEIDCLARCHRRRRRRYSLRRLPSALFQDQAIMLEKSEKRFDPEQVIEEFEALTKDAKRVQIETLKKILKENGEAEYLKRWCLDGKTDPESYSSCVPLVTHKDLEPLIQQIADGSPHPILTGKPITTITLSSGTTQGKRKFVPFNDELIETTMQIYRTSYAFRNRLKPKG